MESLYERTGEVDGTDFGRVIYDKGDQRKRIQDELATTIQFVEGKHLSLPERREIAEHAGSRLWDLVPWLKDSAFYAEQEWRIVRRVPTDEVSEVRFQSTGANVRPYVPFPLKSKGWFPIVELIVLAPGREVQSVKAADMLLRKVGIENVKAERSQVPFTD